MAGGSSNILWVMVPINFIKPTPNPKLVIFFKNLKNVNLLAGLSFLPIAYNLKDSEMIPLDKSNKPPIFLNILPGVQNNPITEEGGGGRGRRFLKIFSER